MNVALVTSLHLDHSAVGPGSRAASPAPMQAFVPVGLLSLKAAADRAGAHARIQVVEVNGAINRGLVRLDQQLYDQLAGLALAAGDDLVGLMTDSDSLHHTVALADAIKRRAPRTTVCLGGPASSPIARLVLETFPSIDYVVRGEGELTLIELLDSLRRRQPTDGIRGLSGRRNGRVYEAADRDPIADLDDLPIPDFDAYDMSGGAPLYLDVGRGCPFECRFCCTAPFWRRRYRMKSIARILEELRLVRDRYGRTHVNFSHDIFTCDRDWTRAFCEQLADARLGMSWTCSTRTDVITPELLQAMARAGCAEIYYGIESGSPALQAEIRKHLDLEWSLRIVQATAAAGIRPITGFIVGYPMETLDTLRATLAKFFEFLAAGGFKAHIFTLCPYQGSSFYRQYGQTATRLAECHDLALGAPLAGAGRALRVAYPAVFASTYRYATPAVPSELVDGFEELSPHLVVLKSVWPRLLPSYSDPLEWYTRWIAWLAARDRSRDGLGDPDRQGTAADLLAFLAEEVVRLGLADDEVADLVRYEQLKLDAAVLERATPAPVRTRIEVGVDTVVVRRRPFVAAPFRRALRPLLAGEHAEPDTGAAAPRWVLCTRDSDGALATVQLPAMGRLLLDVASEPRRVGDLLSLVAGQPAQTPTTGPSAEEGMQLVGQLMALDFLEEVAR